MECGLKMTGRRFGAFEWKCDKCREFSGFYTDTRYPPDCIRLDPDIMARFPVAASDTPGPRS